MPQRYLLHSLFLTLLLIGCQTAQNVSEAIGAGYATLTTVAHDVAAAKASGAISDSQAQDFKVQLQSAKTNLDMASNAYAAGDSANASDRVVQTQMVLRMIIQALKDKGVTTHG